MKFLDTDYNTLVYLDAIWRRRYLSYIIILIMPILAILSTFLLPQKYQASTSIAVNMNALPAMKDINATIDPANVLQSLKAFAIAPTTLQKAAIESRLVKSNSSKLTLEDAAQNLSKNLKINILENSVMEIQLIQNTPKHLVDILNSISTLIINQFNSQASSTNKTSLSILTSTMASQKQKLKESIDTLKKFESTHSDLLPEYMENYQSQLRQISVNLGDKQSAYTSLDAEKQSLEQSLLKDNPVAKQLDRAILDNDVKLSKLRLIYTDNYPEIQALLQLNIALKAERDQLQKQYQNLDKEKMQQMWNLSITTGGNNNSKDNSQFLSTQLEKLLDMQLRLKGMDQAIHSIKEQQTNLKKKLQLITQVRPVIAELKQNIKVNQSAYEDNLSRLNLAKMSLGLDTNDKSDVVRVVAYPQTPTSSLSRPLSFFFFLGLVAGIFFAISIPIVMELMDNTARHKQTIEAATGFDVICRVGQMSL